ncbi:hypothetical protein ABPG75_013274 [Micractinium tetrahymenae]
MSRRSVFERLGPCNPDGAVKQPEQQRRRRRPQAASRSSSCDHAPEADTAAALQDQLRRLQAERDAADELLAQMVQQTQALMAEKQALQRQAAQLATDKAQLEEQLDYLLPGGQEEDWAACAGEGDDSDASACCHEPPTPGAAPLVGGSSLGALQGRLHELALSQEG